MMPLGSSTSWKLKRGDGMPYDCAVCHVTVHCVDVDRRKHSPPPTSVMSLYSGATFGAPIVKLPAVGVYSAGLPLPSGAGTPPFDSSTKPWSLTWMSGLGRIRKPERLLPEATRRESAATEVPSAGTTVRECSGQRQRTGNHTRTAGPRAPAMPPVGSRHADPATARPTIAVALRRDGAA